MTPPPATVGGVLRRYRVALVLVLALAVTLVSAVVWRGADLPGRGLAGEAVVTASSTAPGASARDTVTSGDADRPGAAWQSDGETAGAWIQLTWTRAYLLRQVVIVRNPLEEPGITDGYLGFGDGSFLQVRLSTTTRATVVPVSPRSVSTLRFTASAVSPGAKNVSVAEILVATGPAAEDVVTGDAPDGNAAHTAVATSSPGTGNPTSLQDGSGAAGAAGAGTGWSASSPAGAWAQLGWTRPRELAGIEVVGTPSAASLGSATVTFSDGTRLPVGAVLTDPDRPTIVSFMPRLTTSVRLTVDRVAGSGPLVLGELRAYERGATPVRAPPTAAAVAVQPDAAVQSDAATCAAPAAGAMSSAIVVDCPATGSVVDRSVEFLVTVATGYSSITATAWPGDASAPAGAPVTATPDTSGSARMTLDVGDAPAGPFVVQFRAGGRGRPDADVVFQLYRRVTGPAVDPPPSPLAAGRTLAYAEEFDRPVSLSRTGAGADYAAAKPTSAGAEDFGDAPFAGTRTVSVVDDRYLRIDVGPGPAGTAHVGGLLASARQGGSGFSAQYGYFEARMFAPAAPGTWPAFWTLPSDNLVVPQPSVAEIDAVELYGHEPTGACHSTHGYQDGKDSGVARCGQRFDTERDALAWHTYGVSITPAEVVFSIDGRVVATAPQVPGGGSPMFFLVDLALGGGWPVDLQGVQDRASLYVDYVRVYV